MNRLLRKLLGFLGTALATLALLVLIAWGVWELMLLVPPNTARAWALLATASMPAVAWFFWWLGNTEVRGRLRGFDQAIDKVLGAITRAAGLNADTQIVIPAPQLPNLQILPAQQLTQERTIEL